MAAVTVSLLGHVVLFGAMVLLGVWHHQSPQKVYVVNLGGTVHRIVNAATCTYTIAPTSRSVPVVGTHAGVVGVSAPAGCGWTASSNDPWITVRSGQSGSGNGLVLFSVASNQGSGSPRTGTLTIAGQTFTVTQAGAPCVASISPVVRTFPPGGGTGSVTVTIPSGCNWTAASNVAWVTIASGQSGSGNGTVTYSVDANSGLPRIGTLTIAGRTFFVLSL